MIFNLLESFIDRVFRQAVFPEVGCVVYCDLLFGYAQHSGIYVGGDQIVHLNGSGIVETVSPKEFIAGTTAVGIYISCNDTYVVGNDKIATRARKMVGRGRAYNLFFDNCHQFTSGCITGDFENSDNFLWMLKKTAEDEIDANTWRVWNADVTGGIHIY